MEFINYIMEIQELKSSSKLVFLAIAKYYSVNRSCYPSLQTLCEDCSMTINTVKTAINELVEKKIIKVEKKRIGSSAFKSNTYTIIDCNQQQAIHSKSSGIVSNFDNTIDNTIDNTFHNTIDISKIDNKNRENRENRYDDNNEDTDNENYHPSSSNLNFKFLKIESLEKFNDWIEWWATNDDVEMEKWKKDNNVSDKLLREKIQAVRDYYSQPNNQTHDYREALKNFIKKDLVR